MIALVIVLFILTACIVSLPVFSRKQKAQRAKTLEYQANAKLAAEQSVRKFEAAQAHERAREQRMVKDHPVYWEG